MLVGSHGCRCRLVPLAGRRGCRHRRGISRHSDDGGGGRCAEEIHKRQVVAPTAIAAVDMMMRSPISLVVAAAQAVAIASAATVHLSMSAPMPHTPAACARIRCGATAASRRAARCPRGTSLSNRCWTCSYPYGIFAAAANDHGVVVLSVRYRRRHRAGATASRRARMPRHAATGTRNPSAAMEKEA